MDGIRKKTTQNNNLKQNEIVGTATPYQERILNEPTGTGASERISSNPFFEKKIYQDNTQFLRPKKRSNLLPRIIGVGILFFAVVATITNYFARAAIEVVPTTEKGTINNEFSAVKEAQGNQLVFHFLTLSEEKEKEVPATIEKKIQEKASGKVIIYNNYSKDSQRLIKNTRLETSTGKIFRINESVVVPGVTTIEGKISPGQVEAVVYADAAGDEYNLGVSDFTIPGFKGDPRYTKFFARSVATSPLQGGFSGVVKVASEEDIIKAQLALKEELKKTSIEKAQSELPEAVTFFPGSLVLKFEEIPQNLSNEDKKKVAVKATVSLFFFDTVLLEKKIAEAGVKDYKNKPLSVSNMSSLAFTFLDPVDNIVLSDLTAIRFKISGEPIFVGEIDKKQFIQNIAGKNKSEFSKIIEQQENIKKANGKTFPRWSTSFPSDVEKITVTIISEN